MGSVVVVWAVFEDVRIGAEDEDEAMQKATRCKAVQRKGRVATPVHAGDLPPR